MLVSIVIPCFNVVNYLEECVHSVYQQQYQSIEVICVDNGSTDGTKELLSKLKVKYPDLIIENEFLKGAPHARNKGLYIAKGEWIQFLDADDLLLPEKLSHQVSLLKNSKTEPDFIVGNSYWQGINGKSIIWHNFTQKPWLDLIKGTFGDTCSNLWNKEFLLKINGWNVDVRSSQEFMLLFKCLKMNGVFLYDEKPYTITREREMGSISKNDEAGNIIRYIAFREEAILFLKNKNELTGEILNEYNQTVYRKLIQLFFFNKEEAIKLCSQFFSKKDIFLKLEKISFVEKLFFLVFSIKGPAFIVKMKRQIKQTLSSI
jgi:glycosyltransferase involved in cell wall biosynthesis